MFLKKELLKMAYILIYLGFWRTTVTEKLITPPPPPKGNSNFAFARGVSSLVVRLKNNKLWRSRCLGESLGKESLFCQYDSAAPRRCRRDCRSRADARTHGRALSCVFLLLDVPISHALHRSRCSRCFRRPFALRFSTFIRLLRLAFGSS